MIPKILHRIVLPPMRPAGTVQQYWSGFRALHPGWEMRTWTSESHDDWPEVGHLLGRCRGPAQKADLMRLELLWQYGGVYVDTDCEPVQALDPLLDDDHGFFLGTENGTHYSIGVMGAEPGHPAVRSYIDGVLEGRVGTDLPVNEATGPRFATEVLGDRDDVTVYPPPFFYPEPFSDRHKRRRMVRADVAGGETYTIHRWHGSWHTRREKILERSPAAIRGGLEAAKRLARTLRG